MATDPDSPRVLARLRNEFDAQFLVDHLEGLGIRAKFYSALLSVAPEVRPEVEVRVRYADLDRAQAAREELAQTNPRVR